MFARIEAAEKVQGMDAWQKELATTFLIVAEGIQSGVLPAYQIVAEKSSGSQILYDVSERNSMKPLAALVNEKVCPLPAPLEPHSTSALIQLLVVGTKLREIASSVDPVAKPV